MDVRFCRALWGMTEGITLEDKFRISAETGFHGVEADLGAPDADEIRELSAKYGIFFVAQIFPESPEGFRTWMDKAVRAGATLAVAHSGRDRWTFEQGSAFWREVLAMERDYPIPVAHETHRQRMLFSPWDTARYLEAFPDLKLNLDLSHWCVVCESLLGDIPEWVELAISRSIHLHARVGYEEGPQVPDPSAPEYRRHLDAHLGWWDRLLATRRADGASCLTVTPEFGPPNYQHTLPHTNLPVSDRGRINLWMRDLLRDRWGS
ncbi:TIM barrel protein [bacterium]|nr:TIM barrel protein [bacterium]